jgi:hypothetical protein
LIPKINKTFIKKDKTLLKKEKRLHNKKNKHIKVFLLSF